MTHAATQPPPPPSMARAITPGLYLHKRREAAGMTLREAALCYAGSAAGAAVAEQLLGEAEADRTILSLESLARLDAAFSFDAEIYQSLADGLPTPSICWVCACSWSVPCEQRSGGASVPCSWIDRSERLCSACAERMGSARG